MNKKRLGVAIIGDSDLRCHVAAVRQTDALRLLGIAATTQTHADTHRYASPQDAIDDPDVSVLSVCVPAREREFWVRMGLDRGHWVVSSPLQQYPALSAETCRRLRLAMPLAWSGVQQEVAAAVATMSTVVYTRLRMRVPTPWLTRCGVNLLTGWGQWLPHLAQIACGTLDTIHARSRSFVHGQPTEDHAVALLSFRLGGEGVVEIDAFTDRADWSIELVGEDGDHTTLAGDLRQDRVIGLARLYASLGMDVADRFTQEAREALFLCQWLSRAARRDTDLSRREARRQ